jgi:hypothetical protein
LAMLNLRFQFTILNLQFRTHQPSSIPPDTESPLLYS